MDIYSYECSCRFSVHLVETCMGVADGTIQALLRWKTSESLKLYSFLSD